MPDFYNLSREEVAKSVKSSVQGLTEEVAFNRLKKYGKNVITPEKFLGRWQIFINQFKNPLIYVLLIAGLISLAALEYVDAQVILATVLISAVIGFVQENKANNALKQIKKMIEHNLIVRRGGQEREIRSDELVVGDLIILLPGQEIPADARVVKSIDLQVNEASLTGESLAVFKGEEILSSGTALADRKNMVYAGTTVVGGSGEVLVVAKGKNTELGKISELVGATEESKTPLQEKLYKLSRSFAAVAFFASVLIIAAGLFQGRDFFEVFLTAVAVAVAGIPEGLVVAVTVILILGMKQILKQKALTRKLIAAETLGSVNVICSDKTGTLTQGKMEVVKIIIGEDEINIEEILLKNEEMNMRPFLTALVVGASCNNALIENPDAGLEDLNIIGTPTEVALAKIAWQLGIKSKDLNKKEPRIDELSFSSTSKFMATLHRVGGKYVLYEKGAPENLLLKSSNFFKKGKIVKLNEREKNKVLSVYEEFTARGLRLIGVAFKEIESLNWPKNNSSKDWTKIDNDLTFVGFIALKDPLRPDAKETIRICRQAGIRPIIITGDHPLTAHEIAREIGLDGKAEEVITGDMLDGIDDSDLRKIARQHNIYARVTPQHKLRIVLALKANGDVVAMTGDGLNDSPALKAADVGVCLGSGTDVAKETADIILLDNNFSVIVSAIREGRIIFQNIKKSITYLISNCFSELILIIGSILFNLPLALLPTQILWINIVNGGLPSFSMAFERSDETVLKSEPIKRGAPIIDREMKIIILWFGTIRDLALLSLFIYLYYQADFFGINIAYLRTLFFAILGFKAISVIFSLRNFNLSIFKINHLRNRYLMLSFAVGFILLILAIYFEPLQRILQTVALDFRAWLLILSVGLANIIVIELIKYFFIKNPHAQK